MLSHFNKYLLAMLPIALLSVSSLGHAQRNGTPPMNRGTMAGVFAYPVTPTGFGYVDATMDNQNPKFTKKQPFELQASLTNSGLLTGTIVNVATRQDWFVVGSWTWYGTFEGAIYHDISGDLAGHIIGEFSRYGEIVETHSHWYIFDEYVEEGRRNK